MHLYTIKALIPVLYLLLLQLILTGTLHAQERPPAPGEWELVFEDTFEGDSIDVSIWSERSSSLTDFQRGNKGNNGQAEWNTFDNLEVKNGILTMHAHRLDEPYISPSGWEYPWTGSMMNSRNGFEFTYAYIEERSKLPVEPGFWPAFWTWQNPDATRQQEVDVYEYWSGWSSRNDQFLTTTHGLGSPSGGSWIRYSDFGDTGPDDWNVYGADIRPDGITWYLNGEKVNEVEGTTPVQAMNLISNLAVELGNAGPPDGIDHGMKKVDYIRAWKRQEPTSVSDLEEKPTEVILHQNYPNPFNPTTQITFQVPETGRVSLEVYDMAGRQISLLVDDVLSAGQHSVSFDATTISSGVYIYRLIAGDTVITRKLTLIK